jgi:hypothetical protein
MENWGLEVCMVQVVECMPSKYKALISTPITTKKKKKKEKKRREKLG